VLEEPRRTSLLRWDEKLGKSNNLRCDQGTSTGKIAMLLISDNERK
jgi:hypothetical protein